MDTAHQYTKEIHDEIQYLAAWLPGIHLELGDCGPVDRDWLFSRERSLVEFKVPFEHEPRGKRIDAHHESKGSVEYVIQGEGENANISNLPAGKAGIDIKFTRENAVILETNDAYEVSITDIYQLQRDLLYLARRDRFPEGYAVITNIVTAGATTVLISSSSSAHFTLSAEADLKAGLADLANGSLEFAVKRSKDVSTKILAEPGLTPLFRAIRFKSGILVKPGTFGLLDAEELPSIGEEDSPFEWLHDAKHQRSQP